MIGPGTGYPDGAVPDEAVLLRRIPPDWVTSDGAGGLRPSSQSFDDDQMSVYVEDLLGANGHGIPDVLAGHLGFHVVSFSAGFARALGLQVELDPVAGDPIGYAHAVVLGRKTRSIGRRLADESVRRVWLVGNL